MKPQQRSDFVPPPNTQAALYITPGQYVFQHEDGDGFKSKCLSPAQARAAFAKEPVDTGWLPPNAARWGVSAEGAFMVGIYPAAVRSVFVELKRGTRRLKVPMPPLVFCGVGRSYYVWAVKSPSTVPGSLLCHAPLPNVNSLGLICFGANAHPDVAERDGFSRSWEMFWQAPFTEHHSDGRVRGYEDVRDLLVKLHREKAKAFPASALVQTNTTLDAAVKRLTERERNR
jgi:PRTRC genetic system protein B